MTNALQNIFCRPRFSLYIRDPPHQARERFVARPGRVFCRPAYNAFGGALFLKLENAHD
jgi:hypothetical protein